MDESQVLRALGMSIDLMRPVAAATPCVAAPKHQGIPTATIAIPAYIPVLAADCSISQRH
jgi:hypothetical protein